MESAVAWRNNKVSALIFCHFARFSRVKVILTSSSSYNLTGLCFAEAFRGSFMSLNFWHKFIMDELLFGRGDSSTKSISHLSYWHFSAKRSG